jgi:hypothetical protein
LLGSVLVLLAPAIWNGFPFLFDDSVTFIDLSIRGGFSPMRSAFYASFLSLFSPSLSLWPAMVAQVSMTVLVMVAFARAVLPRLTPGRFCLGILLLSVATSLPWVAAEVLPDILTPLLALSVYLLGFHALALSTRSRVALIALSVFAVAAHPSHLGLAAGLAGVTALAQLATRRMALASAAPRWGLPALVFAVALTAVVTSNFVRTGDVFVNRSGPFFLTARLVQDGIARRLLDDTCPRSGYRLCAYKDALPADSNDYLWAADSPFQKLGGFADSGDEDRRIIVESLRSYPWMHVKAAARDTWEQLIAFRTGDGIGPLNETLGPMKESASGPFDIYVASRQQRGAIGFAWINALQAPAGALSIAALAAILAAGIARRRWDERVFAPAFLLLALLGNAFICGAFSSPHDRYQSRVMWAPCLAALALATRLLDERISGKHTAPPIAGEVALG